MSTSGRFVLRIPPRLHAELKRRAAKSGTSLNKIITEQLKWPTDAALHPVLEAGFRILTQAIEQEWHKELLGIVIFGSTVRGEARESSDVDVLIVLSSGTKIERELYRRWDAKIGPKISDKYSPQFTHLPQDLNGASSLWLEIALEGEIIFENNSSMRKVIMALKKQIARGYYQQKNSHGHPYWVINKDAKS
jgi:predicted nucleotidyltransferase